MPILIAVGSAMVTAAAISAAMATCEGATADVVVQTLWGYGAGLTASGVGVPIGGALIFAGTAIFAAGTIAYFFSNDSATEQWIKESQWGQKPTWNCEASENIVEYLDTLHGLLYSFSAEIWFDPWSNRAGVKIQSQFFQPETKIIIQQMVLKGGTQNEDVVKIPLIIDENSGERKMFVEFKDGPEIDITATFYHKTDLTVREWLEAGIFVDLFGNGKVILPERKKPTTSKVRVFA